MSEKNQISSLPVLGMLLALGLMATTFILGAQFKNLRQPGTITVKGLAEKNFKSDSAAWGTDVETHANSYQEVLDLLNTRHEKLSKFLQEQSFETTEIQIGLPSVGRVYNEVRDEQGNVTRTSNGYNGSLDTTVNTKKLDKVQAVQQAILNLRAQDEPIHFSSPQYPLGNLENIKRGLITQATKDAQKRAVEFAKTDGSKVGAIRSASQGSFNVYAGSGSSEDSEYGGSYDKATVDKQARLVVTIEHGAERRVRPNKPSGTLRQ